MYGGNVQIQNNLNVDEEFKRAEAEMNKKIEKLLENECDENFIFCPSCNTINERGEINDIECTNCKIRFCFNCAKVFDLDTDYLKHYEVVDTCYYKVQKNESATY